MSRIAILASGSGTNAENIINYFRGSEEINVALVISNNESAYVLKRASDRGVEALYIPNKQVKSDGVLLEVLKKYSIDFVVLAGYLQLVPSDVVSIYSQRIVNIHPALLPDFGGMGMYGARVHRAVKEARVPYTGITIHYVTEEYDKGEYILQERVAIDADASVEQIADLVHELEYRYYPLAIESIINNRL